MTRYSYNQQIHPPAPFVLISIHCPETAATAADLAAQIDSGADRTVIPGRLIAELGLIPFDELPASGFGAQVFMLKTYRVALEVKTFQPFLVEVFAHDEERIVLLGRDVLNRFNISLMGPTQKLEIAT